MEELQDTKYEPTDEELSFEMTNKDGTTKIVYDEKLMLAKLLIDDVCFINTRKYLCYDGKTEREETVVVFVNCNDVFYWACADAESITVDEIPELYKMHKKDRWGSVKWCCKKRNMQPQVPIVRDMKKEGLWEDWMDKLEVPQPS